MNKRAVTGDRPATNSCVGRPVSTDPLTMPDAKTGARS